MDDFYLGITRDVSQLLAEGHLNAQHYPIAQVWLEVSIVRQRINSAVKMSAIVQQAVIASCLNSKGAKHLKELLAGIDDGTH